MKISKLEAELKNLEARRAEKIEAERQLGAVAQTGDPAQVKALHQRLAEIQNAIAEGERVTLRLALPKREAELPEAEAERRKATEELAERQATLEAARAEYERANQAFFAADECVRSLRHDIAAARREIAKQDAEAAKAAAPPQVPATPFGWRSL